MKYLALAILALVLINSPLSARSKKVYVKEDDLITLNERLYIVTPSQSAYRLMILHCSDTRGYYFYKKDMKRVRVRGKDRH